MAHHSLFFPSRRPELQQQQQQPPPPPRQSSIQTLEEVVTAGDHESAVQQAAELAIRASSAPAAPVGSTTRVKVRVVDQFDTGPLLSIDVRPAYSVLDLKILMCMEHAMPPPHEQIWIINGRVRDDAELVGNIEPDLAMLSLCLYLKRSDHSSTPTPKPNLFELWWSSLHSNDVRAAGAHMKDTLTLVNGRILRRRQHEILHIAGVPEPVRLIDNLHDPGVPYGAGAAAAALARRPR